MTQKPALLLDVDGVINAYPQQHNPRPPYVVHDDINGYKITVHPHWSHWLRELTAFEGPYELVWATTWMELAATHIAPLLGLPEEGIEHLTFGTWEDRHYSGQTHKMPGILRWYEENPDRPSVWVDDCIYADAVKLIAERDAKVPSRFVRTDPNTGLVIDDIVKLWDIAYEQGWMLGQEDYVS